MVVASLKVNLRVRFGRLVLLVASAEWSLPFLLGGQNGRCLLHYLGRMVVASV